jgi:hypothetical protein
MFGLGKFTYIDDEVDPREERFTRMLAAAEAPEAEMAMIIKDGDAARQANPNNLPNGFFLVKNPNGKRLGFGFYCKRCGLHNKGYSPLDVRHCGGITSVPMAIKISTNRSAQVVLNKRGKKEFMSPIERFKAHKFWLGLKTVIVHPG